MTEEMDIIDDNNVVLGKTTQEDIYKRKLNHRIVHVFVVHPETGEVYFQKRAETKSFLPGYYCTSAGGHVQAGESYLQAAARELKEEIGLETPLQKVHSMIFISDQHKRFIEIFVTEATEGIHFADGEVSSGEWLALHTAHELVWKNEKIHPQLYSTFTWLYEHREKILKIWQ